MMQVSCDWFEDFEVCDCPGRFDYECRFSMPVLGEYAVEVCHKAGPSSICRREFIGQTLDHFKDK